MGIELLMHGFFLLWKNSSFSEYFYSYTRNRISKLMKILSILGFILIPYVLTKMKEKDQ